MDLRGEERDLERKIAQFERDLSRWSVHVDMDGMIHYNMRCWMPIFTRSVWSAFYASVEELDQPDLKTKPMAVGGMSMLCTANYEARKFGVRSAMPGYIAKKLCPELIIMPLNFDKYTKAAEAVRDVFRVRF